VKHLAISELGWLRILELVLGRREPRHNAPALSLSELFGVVFQSYLTYYRQPTLTRTAQIRNQNGPMRRAESVSYGMVRAILIGAKRRPVLSRRPSALRNVPNNSEKQRHIPIKATFLGPPVLDLVPNQKKNLIAMARFV
jgi:hypothetical protein